MGISQLQQHRGCWVREQAVLLPPPSHLPPLLAPRAHLCGGVLEDQLLQEEEGALVVHVLPHLQRAVKLVRRWEPF